MSWPGGGGSGGGGGGIPATETILATAHGFTLGTPPGPIVRVGGAWVAARADSAINAEVQAWLDSVVDANNIVIVEVSGADVTLPALDALGAAIVAGEAYFVSTVAPAVGGAGRLQRLSPVVAGQISKPIVLTRLDGSGALVGRLQQFRASTVVDPAVFDRIGLTDDLTQVILADWLDIGDNPSIWAGAPPANVVTSPGAQIVGSPNSRSRAIRLPGTSDPVNPRIYGIAQAIPAGPFVATVDISLYKQAVWNAAQTAGCTCGLLWVDANGQNMQGIGFDLGSNRAIAAPDSSAFARFLVWNASADANNDPTGVWTAGGGTQMGYGYHRGTFVIERDGANVMSKRVVVPAMVQGEASTADLSEASVGGAGFLVVCMYMPAAPAVLFDLFVRSQLLIGTDLPWLVTP